MDDWGARATNEVGDLSGEAWHTNAANGLLVHDPKEILGEYWTDGPTTPFYAAETRAVMYVPRVDIVGHQQCMMSSNSAVVAEADEDNPTNLVLFVNDDRDEGGASRDCDNSSIGATDDDIVKLTIRRPCPGLNAGRMVLTNTPSDALQFFDASGNLVSPSNLTVDLAIPAGPLAGLANGDVTLYVEGVKSYLDVCLTLSVEDPSGAKLTSDSLHVLNSFELILRRHICEAATNQFASGLQFNAPYTVANCSSTNVFWETNGVGISIKAGANTADAIENIFSSGATFGADCYSALVIVWYKAVLDTFEECSPANGRSKFASSFSSITISSTNSTYPPNLGNQTYSSYRFGDWRYIDNPDFALSTPQFKGFNVIQMTDGVQDWDEFYEHPYGVQSLFYHETTLAGHRISNPTEFPSLLLEANRFDVLMLMEYLFQ